MARILLFLFLFSLAACGNNSNAPGGDAEEAEGYSGFGDLFKNESLPYQLTDTALLENKDTAQIRLPEFLSLVPDSLRAELFGAKAKVRYTPMARFEGSKGTFFLVKASGGNKRAALVAVAEGDQFKAVLPFLVPDNNSKTVQVSVLDKNMSVLRTITERMQDDVPAEGKDVFTYTAATSRFDLVMTDPLHPDDIELINPIDTLARTHKWAGDYQQDKKNMVSVRDGRKPDLLTVFIHIEKKSGACTGEIKGDVQILSPTTAIFRQPGEPCVLNLTFTKTGVTLEEEEGCGSKRGIECSFDGKFPRKKEAKKKTGDQKKVSA
ncbi:hypothetical protein [Paracnuella aquatica]|uniref:hypothetical protein n=1 Tax=Paracnuella aquatica TaxID=2268757 RepID=UPI000DEFF4A7|nr:hypothetical protein [Paracnuella aquatica]RPD51243.1 hypothetical protein DRJ53_00750 [Paracnuella aquatica]